VCLSEARRGHYLSRRPQSAPATRNGRCARSIGTYNLRFGCIGSPSLSIGTRRTVRALGVLGRQRFDRLAPGEKGRRCSGPQGIPSDRSEVASLAKKLPVGRLYATGRGPSKHGCRCGDRRHRLPPGVMPGCPTSAEQTSRLFYVFQPHQQWWG
jgi:hypothetical protein